MILAVASGKGGTGKTTVAVNLAMVMDPPLEILDCDVEEPNVQLFFKGAPDGEETVNMRIPAVDASRCDGCGECARFCRFGAIAAAGKTPLVFPELCHGCGGCRMVCPRGAISETDRRIGVIETFVSNRITLHQGRLDIGAAMAPPLIRAVKARRQIGQTVIIDCPPGTSCPVIAAVKGSDFVVLVTEPTPFGLHDLRLAVEMVREIQIPFGVVINRAGTGDDRVHQYCKTEQICILSEVPDDRRVAEAYSRGDLAVDALPEYRRCFEELKKRILVCADQSGEGIRR